MLHSEGAVATRHALSAGTLILALGNPRAIASNTRGSEPHANLNRVFTDARLADTTPRAVSMLQ
jgi:succinylglutamate desuccinylase